MICPIVQRNASARECETYLVLGEHIDLILVLDLADLVLTLSVGEGLGDWVVLHLHLLDVSIGHLAVWLSLPLEVLFGLSVAVHFLLPGVVVVGDTQCVTVFHHFRLSLY